jgi:pyruvate formate lyase activating enzyme
MEAVRLALEQGCKGISWTYNEPTLWVEYTLDTAKIAKQKGLLTNYVTNAYMTPEALDRMGPLLDAYRADVKGFCDATYRRIADVPDFKTILRTVERARHRWDMHVEIITNLIPGINDEEGELGDLASWIRDELGPDTPWHVTRFHPHLRLSHLSPTPVPQLERAREIGLKTGLKYVYLGNVPGRNAENTFCPGCGRLLIERFNFRILQYDLSGDRCPSCGQVIAGCFDTRGPESTSLG